ncbi:MAG: shufflon system plasmid conjugative transfer pilus tip adhesin PilV, partial [Patescibacteria group bacterium]
RKSWTTFQKSNSAIYVCNGTEWVFAGSTATVPYATASSAGKVQVGSNIDVNANGVINIPQSVATNATPSFATIYAGSVGIGTTGLGAKLDILKTEQTSSTAFLARNSKGNNSWGIVGEFRVENDNYVGDRPSILFSSGYNDTTWSVGYGTGWDDNFRIRQNHGYRNNSWGTERLKIDTDGIVHLGMLQVRPGYLDSTPNGNWTTLEMPGVRNLRIWDNVSIDNNLGIGTTSPGAKLEINAGTGRSVLGSPGLKISTPVQDSTNQDAIYLFENGANASGKQSISWYNGNSNYYKARIWTEVGGNYQATTFGIDTADDARNVATRLAIRNGNVGIGTTSPNQKLDVAGSIKVDGAIVSPEGTLRDDGGGWVRTYGDTGWYSETYGGGWFMVDSTWIRSYGNKSIYQNAGTLRTDGTFQVGSDGSTLNVANGGNFAFRNNVLFANTAGRVGIGTPYPGGKLTVKGWGPGGTIRVQPDTNGGETAIGFKQNADGTGKEWVMGQNSWGAGAGNFAIGIGGTGTYGWGVMYITQGGQVGIRTASPCSGCALDVQGGNVNVGYLGKNNFADLSPKEKLAFATDRIGLDVAELFETREEVEAGDVLVMSREERKLKKSSTPYEGAIIGVVSGSPALVFEGSNLKLGAQPDRFEKGNKPPVALAGRIPVKVSLENGPIHVGDYLTSSSKPGVAMKATKPGMTLGVALENFDGTKEDAILVFLNIGVKNVETLLKELQAQDKELRRRIEALEKK